MPKDEKTPLELVRSFRIQLDVMRQAMETTIRMGDDTIIALEKLEGSNDNRPKR